MSQALVIPSPSPSRVRRLTLDSDDKLGITKACDMKHLYSTIRRDAIVDVLRNHMFIHQMVDAGVPSHLLVGGKSWNNRSTKLHTSLNQRLQRKDRTRVRPFHVSRAPPIDLTIHDRRLERVVGPS